MKGEPGFACSECGAASAKWIGRCPECGAWNSYVAAAPAAASRKSRRPAAAARAVSITAVGDSAAPRLATGLPDLDRVLGGGLVPGSVVLIGGEPGIGKSTLLLQAARACAGAGGKILYVSGEESLRQVRLRAGRLGAVAEELFVLGETDPETAVEEAAALAPSLVVVDSVQSMTSSDLPSPSGSVAQVRNAALVFQRFARAKNVPVVLIGHVTKDGTLAGPKALEHLVDTVLSFEGDRSRGRRILRAMKNRFGAIEEIALYEMTSSGLSEIADPSRALLAERRAGTPGSAVSASIEGTRPLLVEIQALVGPAVSGSARRSAVGLDAGRLAMVLAVLETCAALPVASREIFVSCAGGFDVREPAADLALAAAILSSHRQTPLPADAFYFGEIGLLGEVRSVPDAAARLREGAAHGFREVFLPRSDASAAAEFPDLKAMPVAEVKDLA
ncbi:MAG TPA: DNA repair protein RadA [Thermoanaerobaculia bacterium]|nr:DNA repair protein RadA [Thermoanaerobaculia bacterium]